MIPFLADENFKREIVRGLLRRNPHLDILTAQEAGLTGLKDPPLLAWAAAAVTIYGIPVLTLPINMVPHTRKPALSSVARDALFWRSQRAAGTLPAR